MDTVDKIRGDLLDVIDDPVMLHRRLMYWHYEDNIRLSIILNRGDEL